MEGRIPTVGVEEEYFLVHPGTRAVEAAAGAVVARASAVLGDLVSGEFTAYQVEGRTPPCSGSEDLRKRLTGVRAAVSAAAGEEGLRLCASGTPVIGGDGPPVVGDHPRYRAGVKQYRAMLDDFAICAFHAHVNLPDREAAVLVGNHLRPWLPLLVAMSANSPFHRGQDTGYASWRSVVRGRFPCLGPPPYAESLAHYEQLATAMEESEALLEAGIPFWDVRPNPRLPTLEIRSMDVPANVDDTVALAVLIRALVVTAAAQVERGDPGPRVCGELLRAAYWRAARDGWSGTGVDALTGRILPATVQAGRLVDHVRPALDMHGETEQVTAFLRRLATRGTGAQCQRASAESHGGFAGVVDDLIDRTRPGRGVTPE
ncbi:carboxylate-amine ligase [Streptomyces spiramyceticus]|uniref:carboxylate-amine ligase n=1 Tax=Streptomyces spiramyceticus TaxID=299717 RepID=UPI00237A32F3|nr:glutamate--cysteine ligase [Streptomyces spiramyceticus]